MQSNRLWGVLFLLCLIALAALTFSITGNTFATQPQGSSPIVTKLTGAVPLPEIPEIRYVDSASIYNHVNTTLVIYSPGIARFPNGSGQKDASFKKGDQIFIKGSSTYSRYPHALVTLKDPTQINIEIPSGLSAGTYTIKVVRPNKTESNEVSLYVYNRRHISLPLLGRGCTNAYFIDRDCDGYGVGGNDISDEVPPIGVPDGIPSLGPDANDLDATLTTPATARAKYGGLDDVTDFTDWIRDLQCLDLAGDTYTCYNHTFNDFYFVSPQGDDATGTANDPKKPFKIANTLNARLQPGDVIIFREGMHKGLTLRSFQKTVKGTKEQPILYIAAPGERAIIAEFYNAIVINSGKGPQEGPQEYITFDGLELNGKALAAQERRSGIGLEGSTKYVTFRNLEITRFNAGIFGSVGVPQLGMMVDSSVIHDSQGGQRQPEHGIYLNNADKGEVHEDLVFKDNIIYRRNRHGLQLRPPYYNLTIIRNILHTNAMRGVEIKGSVINSEISNNLFFNNARMPLLINKETIHNGMGPVQDIRIFQNTIWGGDRENRIGDSCWMSGGGGCRFGNPDGDSGLGFLQDGDRLTYSGLQVANNVVYISGGSFLRNDWLANLPTATIQRNAIYTTLKHPKNNSLDLAGMVSRCLKVPHDNTSDHTRVGDGWCKAPNNLYHVWSLGSFEGKGGRTNVKENTLLPASDLPKIFTSTDGSYAYFPWLFDFNPLLNNSVTGTAITPYTSKRDIRGVLRGDKQDAGAYELTTSPFQGK